MYATKHIDWLSITLSERASVDAILPVADWHHVGRGHHGYKSAFEDATTGARLETDSADSSMGIHLQLSGQVLSSLRSQWPNGDDGLVAACTSGSARASRLDLALNAHEGKLTVQDFRRAHKSGALTTTLRRVYYVEGTSDGVDGATLYLGSPKSDRQLRIYDKAAEQGAVDGKSWLRLELALRDLRAKSAFAACGNNLVGPTISAHMDNVIQWNEREFADMVGSVGHAVAPIPRRETSTERWLRDQCAPALAKVVAVQPDFMVQFMASFQDALDKLKSSD